MNNNDKTFQKIRSIRAYTTRWKKDLNIEMSKKLTMEELNFFESGRYFEHKSGYYKKQNVLIGYYKRQKKNLKGLVIRDIKTGRFVKKYEYFKDMIHNDIKKYDVKIKRTEEKEYQIEDILFLNRQKKLKIEIFFIDDNVKVIIISNNANDLINSLSRQFIRKPNIKSDEVLKHFKKLGKLKIKILKIYDE